MSDDEKKKGEEYESPDVQPADEDLPDDGIFFLPVTVAVNANVTANANGVVNANAATNINLGANANVMTNANFGVNANVNVTTNAVSKE